MSKTLIIGLDGMNLKLLNSLIEQGQFSNIGKIKREGVYGEMESTLPHNSVPAWSSFATGVKPAEIRRDSC